MAPMRVAQRCAASICHPSSAIAWAARTATALWSSAPQDTVNGLRWFGSSGRCASGGATPQPASWSQLMQAAITPTAAASLQSRGYAIIDGALPPAICAALRSEIDALVASPAGLVRPNCTHLVDSKSSSSTPRLLQKSGILEAEISLDPAARAAAPLLAAADADTSLEILMSLFVPSLRLDAHGIKAQFNQGGGAGFPIHQDSQEDIDGRRVTAIFYLNKDWQSQHGGELRLYPFPLEPPLDIAPLEGRLVLFSTQLHHRVLPSAAQRYCFTNWLSQTRTRGGASPPQRPVPPPPPAPGDAAAETAARRFLLHPAVRRHVVKLAYAEEWEQSMLQSHPPGEAIDAAIAEHRRGVDVAARALAPYAAEINRLVVACAAGGVGDLPGTAVAWF